MKPYQQIAIAECREPLVPIPLEHFAIVSPHPYEKLGANYHRRSPYYLRQSVVDALIKAQSSLNKLYPDWRIQIFDAYRPLEVQKFMVDYTFTCLICDRNLSKENLSSQQEQSIWAEVYQFWSVPSDDPKTPPPHSTGAAIDVTLVDDRGKTLDLGGEIDEISERSYPNYYANINSESGSIYHQRRDLLREIFVKAGFCRHPQEWWHFSLGDQMWAWQQQQQNPHSAIVACYGRVV
jgi:D-alanyl-D-alanine dipeptidase